MPHTRSYLLLGWLSMTRRSSGGPCAASFHHTLITPPRRRRTRRASSRTGADRPRSRGHTFSALSLFQRNVRRPGRHGPTPFPRTSDQAHHLLRGHPPPSRCTYLPPHVTILINTPTSAMCRGFSGSGRALGFKFSGLEDPAREPRRTAIIRSDAAVKALPAFAQLMALRRSVPAVGRMNPWRQGHPIDKVLPTANGQPSAGTTLVRTMTPAIRRCCTYPDG